MLELRAGRTPEDADQEKQANENLAQKATMISEKAEGFDCTAPVCTDSTKKSPYVGNIKF